MTPVNTMPITPTVPSVDDTSLDEAVRSALDANPGLVRLHLAGKTAMGGLISEVLRRIPGQSPPRILRAIRAELAARIPNYA